MTSGIELIATSWTSAGDVRPGRSTDTSPIPLERRIAAVAASGYAGIGIGWPDLEAAERRIGLAGIRDLVADAGLRHIELEFIDSWWIGGSRRDESDRVRVGLLRAAEQLGARHIKVGCGSFGDTRDHRVLRAELMQLAEQAADHGTRIVLEPGAGSALDLTGEAIPLLSDLAHPSAGILLDPWHLVRAGLPYAQALQEVPAELLLAVELSDGAATCVGNLMDDTFDRRLPPGSGDFDVPAFIRAVEGRGYTGPWGVEVMSDRTRGQEVSTTLSDCADGALRCFPRQPSGSGV